ncbi:MAG TPA: hypothetical protein VLC95_12895 [Anaerolineae bacterium]|nr:hypothetical protein [Anaerolineae bacterium]
MSLRYRRHFKLVVLLVLLSSLLVVGAGDQRIVAYTIDNTSQVIALEAGYQAGLARLDASLSATIQHLTPGSIDR